MEEVFHVGGNGTAQAFQAVVAGVGGVALLQGEDGGLADVPRGDKIRFADAEGDDILAAGDEIEEFADAGAGQIHDLVGEHAVPVHGLRGNADTFI